MTRITLVEDVLPYAFYRAHIGTPTLGEEVTLLVLSHTVFAQKNTRRPVHGIQAFDSGGRHRLIEYCNIGLELTPSGNTQGWIQFEQPATEAEIASARNEAELYHSGAGLLRRAAELARVFLPHVEAIGLFGSTRRHINDPITNPWPSDFDMAFFVSECEAYAHLETSRDAKTTPAVTSARASLNARLVSALNLPVNIVEEVEYILRGGMTASEQQDQMQHGDPRKACRTKKLDGQIVPLDMSDLFRQAFDAMDKDPTFLDTIHPDLLLYDPETGTFGTKNRDRISWPLRPIPSQSPSR